MDVGYSKLIVGTSWLSPLPEIKWKAVPPLSITQSRFVNCDFELGYTVSKLVREIIRADSDPAQQRDAPNRQPFGN
jgi:hypothetical protein